ncbi:MULTISPECIES: 4-hydroxyphenylacetate catabolism regulatory protein HpaA [unclassified Anaerobiospirillum]|uniref:4-hydroxyphenylacetate catabolism regulatory protein HpaA n=1 Tax=unclassified Anaerobiospirillum TaxID=2647410 RepID=UPI001FF47ED8|nr:MULTISPECIES: 4-hydroxyphenylacetate catabolism regulatory protein HpaA [unclassified Anaerobiospirillum]MCK0534080.1 4-hydroxyphenylacetate catabolism regulatory protein HpaA [Anaerobiospirillum sp. NML120511]MCK0539374.1 4-hydroxyphenylacetate catabolism regulatory protein HpaA [Anaerobiospirillum sp. NML02-A-032]
MAIRNIDVAKDNLTFGKLNDVSYRSFSHMASFYGRFMEPHRHEGYFQLHYIDFGYINLNLDDSVNLTPKVPLLILTPPSAPHSFFTTNETTGHVLTVRESLITPIIEKLYHSNPNIILNKAVFLSFAENSEIKKNIDRFFRIIQSSIENVDTDQDLVLSHLVQSLFSYILCKREFKDSLTVAPMVNGDLTIFQNFIKLIEANYHKQLSVPDYARLLSITDSKLKDMCRRFSSLPPKRMIFERVLLEAKRRLVYSDRSINQIASDLGFTDPSYFARFFVRCVGQTPSQWRKRSKNMQHIYQDIHHITTV